MMIEMGGFGSWMKYSRGWNGKCVCLWGSQVINFHLSSDELFFFFSLTSIPSFCAFTLNSSMYRASLLQKSGANYYALTTNNGLEEYTCLSRNTTVFIKLSFGFWSFTAHFTDSMTYSTILNLNHGHGQHSQSKMGQVTPTWCASIVIEPTNCNNTPTCWVILWYLKSVTINIRLKF